MSDGTAQIATTPPVVRGSAPGYRAGEPRTLADAMAGVRRKGGMVVTERWLVIAGGVMMPLGAVLVLLAWYGAAHTSRLFEQIPYLISGGVFGLALVVLGAACYFGYWLARLVAAQRDTLGALLRVEELLSLGGAAMGSVNGFAPAAPAETFVATTTGTMYHRAECPVVINRSAADLHVVSASSDGLVPCGICLGPI